MFKETFINLTLPSNTKSFFCYLYDCSILEIHYALPVAVRKAKILPSVML